MTKTYRTYPLRTSLVIAVIATALTIVLILCLGSGVSAYAKTRTTFRLLWIDIAKGVSDSASEKVINFFQNGPIALKMIEGLVVEEQLSLNSYESIFDICHRALKENPQFMTVYFIDKNKTFYGVFRDEKTFGASLRDQKEGKTLIRNFKIGDEHTWIQTGELTGDYDPEKRPFWETAIAHPKGGWSNPYRFATSGKEGYSYVLGQDSPQGIIGYWVIDFPIDQLHQFLKGFHLGQQGIVSLVTNDGELIAQSQNEKSTLPPELKIGMSKLGKRIYYVNPFPQGLQIPWKVITSIHESDYLTPIRKTALYSLLYGLIPVFFFLILTATFFGRMSRRLKEIAWELDELGHLHFIDRPSDYLPSRIREVNVMNYSIRKMKAGLQSFAKYIPVNLVKKLILSGHAAEVGAEKKEITVLFADISGFTALAEHLSGTSVAKIIEEFFTVASAEIHKEQGIIDKFIGDAVMALWGTPEPLENAALFACKAALAIQKRLQDKPDLKYRIGINTGFAMVGNFGSNERLDYTAIGDAVNVASRLEKLNKETGTQILIGPDTAARVEKWMQLRPIKVVTLEGRAAPIQIYELLGPS